MSIQAGTWNFDGRPPARELLLRISSSVAEYGPDGEQTFFDSGLGMLYRPFHTTAESRLERQPHVSASGKVMTWDGRLDNREEILAQLGETPDRCRTDLAIADAAFDRWETGCFAKFIGDWAMVIWDPSSQELHLARDYAGIRHLFYHPKPNSVVWCTHLKPLALCGDQFHLCEEYIAGFLTLWPEAHRTPYAEIYAVPPGHFVRICNGSIKVRAYWEFNPRLTTRYKADTEYEEHFRQLFRHAVRQRMRTDSPILADLSGGLDSSSIVCMADDVLAKEEVAVPSLDTFTALIRDEPGEEDSRYFTAVEQKRGRIGHRVDVSGLEGGSPFELADFVATPGLSGRPELNNAKSDIIRRGGYRVLWSGTGGDEMLGQALDPRVQIADLLRRLQLFQLASQLNKWSLLLRRPWIHLLSDAVLLQMPICIRIRSGEFAQLDPWVNRDFAQRQHFSARQLDVAQGPLSWLPSARDWFQTIITLTRQMSATQPVAEETRYPYLDQKLVEFLISIPTEQLLRPGHRRSLMRRALADLLPDEIVKRRTKASAGRYFSANLEKHWHELESLIESSLLARCGYIERDQFSAALMQAKHGNLSPFFLRLFKALSLEIWLRSALNQGVIRISAEPIGVATLPSRRTTARPSALFVNERPLHNHLCSTVSAGRGTYSQQERR